MSQSDEILESTPTTYTVDYEYEPHIIINDDRTITIPEELVHIAVRGDHNIETVTFDCPRYWDNHDLSAMKIQINYRRPDGRIDPYPVKNIRIDEVDDSQIHFDWTISGNVTEIKGNISFTVCAKLSDEEGNRELEWHSRMSHGLIIDDSLDCSGEELAKQYPDIIENILLRLDNIIDGSFVTIKSVTESTVDGGSNIITFSDGTILSIKNGSKGDVGPRGYKGDNGYTPQKGIDYWTEDEKVEIAELVASQNQNDFVALATGTKIAANTDLDTMLTFGNYKCTNKNTVKTLLNCPVTTAFIMRVGSPAPDIPNYYYQEIITLRGQRHYRFSENVEVKDEETGEKKNVLKWLGWRHSFETVENISSDLGETVHLKACQKFVAKMNEFAQDIGMVNTTFKTPSGLNRNMINIDKGGSSTNYNNKTTARDLLRALVAVKHTPTVMKAMGAAKCGYFKNTGTYYIKTNIAGNAVWNTWAYEHGYTILASKGGSLGGTLSENGPSGILNNASLIQDTEGNVYAVAVLGLHHPNEWKQDTTYSKGDKVNIAIYSEGDKVKIADVTYISLKDNNKNHLVTDEEYWKVGTSGGEKYLNSTAYSKGDKVLVDNVTYVSLQDDNKNHAVTDEDYWGALTYEGETLRTLIHDLIRMANGESESSAITEAKNRTYPVCMAVVQLTGIRFDEDIVAVDSCIYLHGDDEIRVAASTSKIITALVANRYMGNYQCSVNYDDLVGGSGIKFAVGDEISAPDAMNLMLAVSDNTMATMLARVYGTRM